MASASIQTQPITVVTKVPVPIVVRSASSPALAVQSVTRPVQVEIVESVPVRVQVSLTGPGPSGPAGPAGPPGPPGDLSASQIIWGETPGGRIDGVNRNFTSAYPYSPNLCKVFLNGIRLRRAADYNETGGNSFSFLTEAPLPGDSLSIDYVRPDV